MQKPNSRIEDGMGCEHCRARHLKCDDRVSGCAQCEAVGTKCVRDTKFRLRYEVSDIGNPESLGRSRGYVFRPDQTWLLIRKPLIYVDGFQDVEDFAEDNTELPETSSGKFQQPLQPLEDAQPDSHTPAETSYLQSPSRMPHTASRAITDWQGSGAGVSPDGGTNRSATITFHSPLSFEPCNTSIYSSCIAAAPNVSDGGTSCVVQIESRDNEYHSQGHDSSRPWANGGYACPPFADKAEALLFRHFVEYLSPWFDLTDPHCSFRVGVCQHLQSSTTLREALFALSSRHLSDLGNFNATRADEYQQRALNSLIPCLGDLSACHEDTVLAATVMLRVTEELEARAGTDSQAHLMGTKAIINAMFDNTTPPSPFRKAAFWTGFRQEVGTALRHHNPVGIPLDLPLIEQSLMPTDEGTWANRIVVHLAEVTNFSFSPGIEPVKHYHELKSYALNWYSTKPSTLDPFFVKEAKDDEDIVFPELWYSSDAAVVAAQYYNLTCMLLYSFSPETPRIGSTRLRAEQEIDHQLRLKVKEMCGVALCNPKTVPATLLACDGIALCGDRFTDPKEQQALMDFLLKAEREIAWPTTRFQRTLKRSWDV